MSTIDSSRVPARLRERFDDIVTRTDAIASAHLDAECGVLCRRMAAALARRRPSPLERGEARTWAAGIVHAVGWVNFLGDPSQVPHMTTPELAAASGVGQSTIAATFRTIRTTLDLTRFQPQWTLPNKLLDNPLAWLVLVDGVPMDLREAPREVQEAAYREGLIPFVPEAAAAEAGFGAAIREATGDAERVLKRTLAEHPDASIEELDAALQASNARYNRRPQTELGGLSPVAVRELLDADWESAQSAIQLDDAVALVELEGAHTLHDARLVLTMLTGRASVKATPKGNLPRAFVDEFRSRMRRDGSAQERLLEEPPARREEDFLPLHLARVLLEVAGLVKRRRGVFSRTRRGDRLGAEEHAGELLVTLVRTLFRRVDLAYLDGLDAVPEFQRAIGYSLYQLGRVGGDWRSAAALAPLLLLPIVREALPVSPWFDTAALVLEARLLRPLVGFGLVEQRRSARAPGELLAHAEFRTTPLFGRVVRFRVAGGEAGG